MFFQQYQLACLSLSSYLVGDETTGRAVVVDPQRDIGDYLADAEANNLTIEKVLLTHFHADYVSGHLELAQATGAEICLGPVAEAEFAIHNLADGERIELGEVVIEAWATPGHTPESTTFVVYEHADDDVPYGILTGDTLFVGDVGRPDLLGAIGFTAEELGRQLYDSVHRLADLPDATRVYPGHGAGSACGKALGSDPFSTIGEQKQTNYALQPMTVEAFVDIVTEGQPSAPQYFLHDAITNRKDHAVFDENRELVAMTIAEVEAARASASTEDSQVIVVDTRQAAAFAAGYLRGAVNVALDGRFAEQAGMVVRAQDQVILAGEANTEREAMVRLARIGFDNVIGYIGQYEQALQSTPDAVVNPERMTADEIAGLDLEAVQLLDVRNPGETNEGIIPGASVIPLAALPARVGELDPAKPVVVYCASGVRSSTGSSWLRAHGFDDVRDVMGGYQAWSQLVVPQG